MSIINDSQNAVVTILEDDLPALVSDSSASISAANVKLGFVDPFSVTKSSPLIYVYGVGRGSIEDEVGFVPVDMAVMLIQSAKHSEAAENAAVYSDLITDLLVDEVPLLSLAYDIQNLKTDIYFGPVEAKQKIVSVVSFTILAHYRRADR